MQERKNKRSFVLLAALTIATLVVFWWIQPENRLDVDQDIFQVEDLNAISKVELSTDTGRVSLAFNGTRWRVNEKYDADGNMIRVMFATLQQARPKRAVTRAKHDSIYDHLATSGTRVALYRGQELRKEFFAGGNASRTQAFFADPSTREVYAMAIPGYRAYVSGIFEMDESGWRDKFVFGFNWRNFKSLEAEFLQNPQENFRVTMENGVLLVEGVASADTAKLNSYLDDVSLLTVDDFVPEPGLRDSLSLIKPQFRLLVTDVASHRYELRLYNTPGPQVFGIIQDADAALFERRKIQRLLRPKSFFRKK